MKINTQSNEQKLTSLLSKYIGYENTKETRSKVLVDKQKTSQSQ